jgi:hypothetical protein
MTQAVQSPYVPPATYVAQDEEGYCYKSLADATEIWWVENELQRRRVNYDVYRSGRATSFRIHDVEFHKLPITENPEGELVPCLPTDPYKNGYRMIPENYLPDLLRVDTIPWTRVQWE